MVFNLLSVTLLGIGFLGLTAFSKNLITSMLALEIMFLGVLLNFCATSLHTGDPKGHVYALLILGVAAAEAAVGLTLCMMHIKKHSSIHIEDLSYLKESQDFV